MLRLHSLCLLFVRFLSTAQLTVGRPTSAICSFCSCRPKFWWTSTFNALGLIATFVFLPDPARISLAETDRRWRYLCTGKTYHGEAINSKSISW